MLTFNSSDILSGKIQLWWDSWDSKQAAFGFDGIQISVPKSNNIKENPKILSYAALKSNHGLSIKARISKLCM